MKLGLAYTIKQQSQSAENVFYIGGLSTRISYNSTLEGWIITDAVSNVTAFSKAKEQTYALGKHMWTVNGDNFECFKKHTYTTELKLSGCLEGQFTCNDGQCVQMDERCNQLPNCRDKSDERDCNILHLEEGYNKRVPPISSGKRSLVKVPVSVSIILLKVVDIEEEDLSIELQFEIILEWIENRATFKNLKNDSTLNALSDEEMRNLWLPRVVYANTDQKETTRLGEYGNGEWDTQVVVKKKGHFTRSGVEEIEEAEVFKGEENSLVMQQTYTHEFQCIYNLMKYPFGTQVIHCTAKHTMSLFYVKDFFLLENI